MLATNPKQFWNVVSKKEKFVISLKAANGDVINSDECARVLNDVFIKSFQSVINTPICRFDASDFLPMGPVLVDPFGIVKIIDNLKLSSSAGTDSINSKFLKNTKMYCSLILSQIFSQSLSLGELPADWKIGKVVPIHKGGDKHCPNNYRPISLTSIPCKILEHIIYSQLVQFLESNLFFSTAQHGFRKSFSCETQLLSFTHDLHLALDRGSQVDCIFFYFSKAFDEVSHKLLLLKLNSLNIDANVLSWITCFLTNRSQFVTANDETSPLASVHSGVPQGSVLGPLLFLIYINDLPNSISSSISLFADDCVIYREVTNASDVLNLQTDINHVSKWCELWGMELNTTKCKAMTVSRKCNFPSSYFLEDVPLHSVSSYKYLGVYITSDISWQMHVEYVINNANRMLGYLKRNFSLAPSSLKLTLYKTLVRSKLQYASSIWDPGHSKLTNALELVQNRSARFILNNFHRTASVSSMKTSLLLPNLNLRRKIARLCLFHKIYHTNSLLHNRLLNQPSYISPRIDHMYKVDILKCNTNAFQESFIPKTSVDWNHLPASIATIVPDHLFRTAINNLYCSD